MNEYDKYHRTFKILGHGIVERGPSGVSTVEMERTLKSLNGYHEVEYC